VLAHFAFLFSFYFVVAYWAKMSASPNLEDEIRKLIEQSNPVDILEIGSGRCLKESTVMARARGNEDVYLVLRSSTVTCIDLINTYIASRSANPPTITEVITYAKSIGVTGVQQVYAYLKKLCTAGLVQFRYKCGAKGRCDVIQGCPITAVEPTELGITYALATAQLTKANQLAPLRQEAEKRGITPQASPMIRLAILKTPKATAHIIKLINTKH